MVKTPMSLQPKISVVIPTRNRYSALKRVLHALERQDSSRYSFEVIVVDDGSTDITPAFLAGFSKQTLLNFKYFIGKGESAGAARNYGVAQAKGEYLLFLDTDTIPGSDVVRKHLQLQNKFADSPVCIMGRVTMSPELVVETQARVWETELHVGHDRLEEVDWWTYRTANTSFKRELYNRCGGFNPKLVAAEDTELAYRLNQLNVRFYYDDTIHAVHYHPMTIRDYLRKGDMYGRAVAYWYAKDPELRPALAQRYGVYAMEISSTKKMKYLLRTIFVNRLTLPIIVMLGKKSRKFWFELSDNLYKCAYRYQVRRAFRESLAVLN